MGSTLEHGIYLPSEGEKNCYQGLAGNWNKVDGALGDVAELKQSIESKFTKEIVTELPTEDINPFCIYMILKTDPETDNIYDEWVYINNSWEYLGNTKVDMTQYYTKQEVNQLPAVASGVTSTKVGNYDAHIANGDIHVTASDKAKWNTVALIKQLRLVNTQVGSATTIAFANIDDTNGIKVGDKCMDLDGKMFEITAVDTTNQTVTVGTALVDLALDANVVHTSGNETISGDKTFANSKVIVGRNTDIVSVVQFVNADVVGDSANGTSGFEVYGSSVSDANKIGGVTVGTYSNNGGSYALIECNRTVSGVKSSNVIRSLIRTDGSKELSATVDNDCKLGSAFLRWSKIYGTEYYYGSNNVEFSTKFVTSDTAQTITEIKTFTNTIKSQKEIEFTGNRLAYILPEFSASYSGLSLCTYGSNGSVKLGTWKVDGNDNTKHVLDTSLGHLNVSIGSVNSVNIVYLTPRNASKAKLGDSVNKWHEINGLTPSSLSMPTDNTANIIDISGYLTVLDGSQANTYQAPDNGYIGITMNNCTGIQAYITGFWGNQIVRPTAGGVRFFMPICKNMTANILIFGGTINNARFFPCQGNI